MTLAFVNGPVLTDRGFESGKAVLVEGARIVDIVAQSDPQARVARQHDLGGRHLLPGFIDCQVNGGGGVMFNDAPTVETIARIAAAHRPFGTSGFLPTLITDNADAMQRALVAVSAAIEQGIPGVLGIHFEGPFLSPQRHGVHDPAKFHDPSDSEIELICSLHNGRTLLTIAPECVATETLHRLAARDIVIAAGHTAANYDEMRHALHAGLRGFTHLFNAMSPLQSREPGAVGAALDDAESWCGIIVDGHHVHPAALRIAIAAKPKGKMFLVTDAMAPVGSTQTSFTLNGETVTCRDGMCLTPRGVLAGSCLNMAAALRNAVELLDVPLDEAARMASTYPAAFLGLEWTHGHVAPGYRADFVVLNDDLSVHETWIGGCV